MIACGSDGVVTISDMRMRADARAAAARRCGRAPRSVGAEQVLRSAQAPAVTRRCVRSPRAGAAACGRRGVRGGASRRVRPPRSAGGEQMRAVAAECGGRADARGRRTAPGAERMRAVAARPGGRADACGRRTARAARRSCVRSRRRPVTVRRLVRPRRPAGFAPAFGGRGTRRRGAGPCAVGGAPAGARPARGAAAERGERPDSPDTLPSRAAPRRS